MRLEKKLGKKEICCSEYHSIGFLFVTVKGRGASVSYSENKCLPCLSMCMCACVSSKTDTNAGQTVLRPRIHAHPRIHTSTLKQTDQSRKYTREALRANIGSDDGSRRARTPAIRTRIPIKHITAHNVIGPAQHHSHAVRKHPTAGDRKVSDGRIRNPNGTAQIVPNRRARDLERA